MWGREACHLTQLVHEPVYFVSGLNFPVGRLGLARRARDRDDPVRGRASTRCASWRSPDGPCLVGTPPPEVEALILVAMTVVFLLARPLDAPHASSGWPAARAGCRSGGSEPRRRARRCRRPASARRRAAASTRRATAGAGSRDAWREFRTAARLGWQIEANWTDPVLFFIYSVAKPVASALILVVMIDGHRRRRRPASTAASSSSAPRCGRSSWPASPGWPGRSSTTASATGCSSTSYVSPSDFLVVLLGRGRRADRGRARWARSITLAFGVIVLGVPFDPRGRRLARCSLS